MQYNSSIRSRLLEPVLDLADDRIEFRFAANELYKTNMRLMNMGYVGSAASTLNPKAGILAMIEEVTLYDNNQILDTVRPAYNFLSFKSNLVSNRKQIGIKTTLVGSLKNTSTTEIGQLSNILTPPSVTEDSTTTGNFTINLRDILPICRASDYMPTQVFKNLRLVVVFKKGVTTVLTQDITASEGTTKANPLLAVDMVNNPSVVADVLKSFRGVGFNAIEYDSFTDGANSSATGIQTTVSKRLFGLDNKFVNRMLIFRSPLRVADLIDDDSQLVSSGLVRAIANVAPTYQISLNGSNMFVNSITESAEVTAMTHDTWGQFATSIVSNKYGTFGYTDDGGVIAEPVSAATVGYADSNTSSDGYFGCMIQNRIQSLEVSVGRFQRSAPAAAVNADTVLNQVQLVNIWAEVRKSIVVDAKLGYVVIYN
tara:strand:- start:640 stop:1917 length:1278 start_codon:yes stop_codon:yes gene_type:complete